MLASLTAQEFSEWMAFFAIEVPGEHRMDARFANLMALTANCQPRKRGVPPFKASQFMPDLRTPEERQRIDLAVRAAEAEVEQIRRETEVKLRNGGAG